jgi:3D (Asp-Asp-Asp) domain-containing protein/LysM repeat protein
MEGKRMLNKVKTILAVAVLSGTVSANVQAETVQKGDTLWELSQVHNTSVEEIQKLNNLTTDVIHPGDELKMIPEKQYQVIEGDTIWSIALENQVSVAQIKEWNNLKTDVIHPGLNLLIFDNLHTKDTVVRKKDTNTSVKSEQQAVANTSKQDVKATKKIKPAVKVKAKVSKKTASKAKAASTKKTKYKEITVKATAYTAYCKGCSGITATGINLKANPKKKVIAVDPKVIPLGTKVYVEGYGHAIAGDKGGAIKGKRIDVFIPSKKAAINYGVKNVKVKILD